MNSHGQTAESCNLALQKFPNCKVSPPKATVQPQAPPMEQQQPQPRPIEEKNEHHVYENKPLAKKKALPPRKRISSQIDSSDSMHKENGSNISHDKEEKKFRAKRTKLG